MPDVVIFTEPRRAILGQEPSAPLGDADVRIRTEFSGISAGTELTAYRGQNPYLHRRWDPELRLFREGDSSLAFPVVGWGYEEVGTVVETGPGAERVRVGDRVWGSWGHRSETVKPGAWAAERLLEPEVDPLIGVFAKIGAIALNAVLDAETRPGETVVVFGLGVPGQLAASFAHAAGARVVGVDLHPARRELALARGAALALDPAADDVALAVRELTGGRGADVAIEISGAARALHEAIRTVAYNSRVVVAGFHQGDAVGLRLGEEFHHNRIALVSSQISGVATELQHRWDELRLSRTAVEAASRGDLPVLDLVSRVVPAADAGDAFRAVDDDPSSVLQVVLDFREPAGALSAG